MKPINDNIREKNNFTSQHNPQAGLQLIQYELLLKINTFFRYYKNMSLVSTFESNIVVILKYKTNIH